MHDRSPPRNARSRLRNVRGVLVVRLGDHVFPDAQWDDFVPIILNWWLAEMTELVAARATNGRFRFMDGPYELQIDRDEARIRLVRKEIAGDDLIAGDKIDLPAFAQSLLAAAESVHAACSERGLVDAESRALPKAVADLRRVLMARLK